MIPTRPRVGFTWWLALATTTGAHLALRSLDWRWEWDRGVFQYGFAVVLSAPIALAIGAFTGRRLRAAEAQLVSVGARARAVRQSLEVALTPVVTVHVLGLAVAVAAIWSTTRTSPPAHALLPCLAPVLQLCAATTIGWSVGWWLPQWWSAPLAAAGWFLGTIALYLGGLEVIIRVGGSTGDFLGYRAGARFVGWQVAFWSVVLIGAIALCFVHAARWMPAAVAAAVGLAVGVGAAAVHADPPVLSPLDMRPHCSGSAPQICLLPGYEALRSDVSRDVHALLRIWSTTGAPGIERATQLRGQTDPERTIHLSLPAGYRIWLPSEIVAASLGRSCWERTSSDRRVRQAWDDAIDWLAYTGEGGGTPWDWLVNGTDASRLARARAAVHTLRLFCHGVGG